MKNKELFLITSWAMISGRVINNSMKNALLEYKRASVNASFNSI